MEAEWSCSSFHTRTCCIVLLSCPETKSKNRDITFSSMYVWVRFSVLIVICRTYPVWLSWNCVLPRPWRPSQVPQPTVYRFTFLEHTEHSQWDKGLPLPWCNQYDKVIMYLRYYERKYSWRRISWVVLLRGLILQESQNLCKALKLFSVSRQSAKICNGNFAINKDCENMSDMICSQV